MREQLIELLKRDMNVLKAAGTSATATLRLADSLIENGVTIQKWIPVSERLPEIPDGWAENPNRVLYMMRNTGTIYAGYYGEGGVYRDKYFRQYHDRFEGVDANDVLCWMWQHDLPELPKGE